MILVNSGNGFFQPMTVDQYCRHAHMLKTKLGETRTMMITGETAEGRPTAELVDLEKLARRRK